MFEKLFLTLIMFNYCTGIALFEDKEYAARLYGMTLVTFQEQCMQLEFRKDYITGCFFNA